jgi:hypothetical protein
MVPQLIVKGTLSPTEWVRNLPYRAGTLSQSGKFTSNRTVRMTYVPIVTQVQQAPTSTRARQLSVELEQVIEDFQRSYPDTKPGDVRDAMRLAWGGTGGASAARAKTQFVALLGGLMMMLGLGVYFFVGSGEVSLGAEFPWLVVAIGVMAVVTLGVFLINRD